MKTTSRAQDSDDRYRPRGPRSDTAWEAKVFFVNIQGIGDARDGSSQKGTAVRRRTYEGRGERAASWVGKRGKGAVIYRKWKVISPHPRTERPARGRACGVIGTKNRPKN
jgi:hypothetical protein